MVLAKWPGLLGGLGFGDAGIAGRNRLAWLVLPPCRAVVKARAVRAAFIYPLWLLAYFRSWRLLKARIPKRSRVHACALRVNQLAHMVRAAHGQAPAMAAVG